MTNKNAPDGMIPAEEFAISKGLSTEKVISMVKDGLYVGRIVDEQWYVKPSEGTNSSQKLSINPNNISYTSDYEVAKKVSKFMSFLGWFVFGVGILSALLGLVAGVEKFFALISGVGLAISGLFLIAAAQVTRATVDNADHTREILNVLRNKD